MRCDWATSSRSVRVWAVHEHRSISVRRQVRNSRQDRGLWLFAQNLWRHFLRVTVGWVYSMFAFFLHAHIFVCGCASQNQIVAQSFFFFFFISVDQEEQKLCVACHLWHNPPFPWSMSSETTAAPLCPCLPGVVNNTGCTFNERSVNQGTYYSSTLVLWAWPSSTK